MLTIGDPFPRSPQPPSSATSPARSSREITGPELPRQVEGRLLLAEGLHVRLPDRDRRVRQARPATSPTATRRCSACSIDSEYVHLAWRNDHPDLKDLPFPMLADIKRELSQRARRARQARGRGAARDVHRRPAGRHPLRVGQRPQRRPQPAGGAARARRAADRRAVPVQLAEGRGHARPPRWRREDHDHRRNQAGRLPDYARDLRLNLGVITSSTALSPRAGVDDRARQRGDDERNAEVRRRDRSGGRGAPVARRSRPPAAPPRSWA